MAGERAKDIILSAKKAFEAGDYIVAKYLANEVYNMRDLINRAWI
jgi:hypothetical protein